MDWRSAFLSNWPYKIAAVSLSLLLWFSVTTDEERRDQPVQTRLEIEVADSGWVAVEAPDEVSTIFQGRSGDMFALVNQPVIRKVIESVDDTVVVLDLAPGDVAFDRSLSVRPVAVEPRQVEVRLEPLIERRVPVIIQDISVSAAEGFAAFSPIVRPESVTVRGARSEVRSITFLQTVSARFSGIRQAQTRQIAVQRPQGVRTVRLEPAQVLVTIEVDSLAERQLLVPVRIAGPGAEGAVASPGTVRVTLRGPRTAIEPLTAADVTATVSVAEPLADARSLRVDVRLPEGLPVTAAADPPLVTIAPRESGP